jgi:hypothetical protein
MGHGGSTLTILPLEKMYSFYIMKIFTRYIKKLSLSYIFTCKRFGHHVKHERF